MAVDTATSCLQTLPLEMLYLISECISFEALLKFSCVNKKMRSVAIPRLFRQYTAAFSEEGFGKLDSFCKSGLAENVLSLTYQVKDLIDQDILDYEYYRTEVLTPDEYVSREEDVEGVKTTSYLTLYNYFQLRCIEEEEILGEKIDLTSLSFALKSMPKLSELVISFEDYESEDWIKSYQISMLTRGIDSLEHHLETVTDAIKAATNSGLSLKTAWLSCRLDGPWFLDALTDLVDIDGFQDLMEGLIGNVEILGLEGTEVWSVILPDEMPPLRQLHLRNVGSCLCCIGRMINNSNIGSIRLQNVCATIDGKIKPISKGLISSELSLPASSVQETTHHCPNPDCMNKDLTVMLDKRARADSDSDSDEGWSREPSLEL